MKTYNSPMLQVVSIKNNVIATSGEPQLNGTYNGGDVLAPDRFNMFGDSWANAGY